MRRFRSREGAQFFIDILFKKGENIRDISGYINQGEYAFIQIKTSRGLEYTAGMHRAGQLFQQFIPGNDGLEATAFVGETSKSGCLRSLKLILSKEEHFRCHLDTSGAGHTGHSQTASALTPQGGRRRVLPDLLTTTSSSGHHKQVSCAGENRTSANRITITGSSHRGVKPRPWSSQGRQSKQGWDLEGSEIESGLPAVRPQSATIRRSKEESFSVPQALSALLSQELELGQPVADKHDQPETAAPYLV